MEWLLRYDYILFAFIFLARFTIACYSCWRVEVCMRFAIRFGIWFKENSPSLANFIIIKFICHSFPFSVRFFHSVCPIEITSFFSCYQILSSWRHWPSLFLSLHFIHGSAKAFLLLRNSRSTNNPQIYYWCFFFFLLSKTKTIVERILHFRLRSACIGLVAAIANENIFSDSVFFHLISYRI